MHKLKCLLLTLVLYTGISPVAAYADGCKVSAAVERDGYIVADQTKVQNQDMLVNHVLAIIGGVIAGIKLFTARCVGFTPSYYIRNGASIVGGLAAIQAMIEDAKASKRKLEAHLGDTSNPDIEKLNEQIAALEEAEKITLDAYNATKKKEKIYKFVSTLQRAAIAAAAIEIITKSASLNPLMHECFPNEAAMLGAKASVLSGSAVEGLDGEALSAAGEDFDNTDFFKTDDGELARLKPLGGEQVPVAVESPANSDPVQELNGGQAAWDDDFAEKQSLGSFGTNAEVFAAGKTLVGGLLMQAVVRMVLGEYAGEQTPVIRTVYYGTMELISLAVSGDKADAADCLKQRADEYGRLADALRQRFGINPNPAEDGTGVVDTNGGVVDLTLASSDFGGCAGAQGGQVVSDPSCTQPLQFPNPTFTGTSAGDAALGIPGSLISGIQTANRSLNATLGGNPARGASLASGLGSNAFSKKNLDALKKKINKDRVAAGQRPVDFDGLSKKTHSALKRGVGAALQKAGINSIADFNRAFLENKPVLAKAAPKLDKEDKGKAKDPFAGAGTKVGKKADTGFSFGDFLGDVKEASLDDQLADAQDANLDQYEVSGNDYSTDRSGDIFKMITTRYFKSGYSALLEEKPKKDKP